MKKAGFYLFYGLLGTAAVFVSVAVLKRAMQCCQSWAACCCRKDQPLDQSAHASDIDSHDSEANPETHKPDESQSDDLFIGNPRTKKLHTAACRAAPAPQDSALFQNRQEALENGYAPCGICKP